MIRGKLIVLEGLDGAGTTTQAHALVARLGGAIFTCQPSDGPIGVLLRAMLRGQHPLPWGAIDQRVFTLLFAADRLDHLARIVEPTLASGRHVVCDRYVHSSLAYQATQQDPDWIASCNRNAPAADLVIFVRVAPEICAARRRAAGRTDELFEDLAMQRNVAANYERFIAASAARGEQIEIIDGELPTDQVTEAIWSRLAAHGIGAATAPADAVGPSAI